MDPAQRTTKNPKPKGRPQKEHKDEPLESRRARGREAQKLYKARKQAETNQMRERIIALEEVVDGMSHEFIQFGERLTKSSGTSRHPLVLEDLKKTTGVFLKYARKAGESDNEEGAIVPRTPNSRSMDVYNNPSTPQARLQEFQSAEIGRSVPFGFSTLFAATRPNDRNATFQQSKDSAILTPRLGYGIIANLKPTSEDDWSRYRISGPNSFALRLYKESLILIINALTGKASVPGFIPSVFRYRFRYEMPDEFVTLATEQMNRMTIKEINDELLNSRPADADEKSELLWGPSDAIMLAPLRRTIHQDVKRELGSLGEWLDPWSTQLYLQENWGFKLSAHAAQVSGPLQAFLGEAKHTPNQISGYPFPMIEQSQPTPQPLLEPIQPALNLEVPERSKPTLDIQPLVKRLVGGSVCFGEGPRFTKEQIDMAAAQFLASDSL